MYESHWGLTESPFAAGLSTKWLHESPVHEEALARLFYLVEQRRGFGLLTGAAGTGKSLLARHLSSQVRRSQRKVASIDVLGMDAHEMLFELANSLELMPHPAEARWDLWRRIHDHITALQLARIQAVFVFDHLERADSSCHTLLERLFSAAVRSGGLATFIATVRSQELTGLSGILGNLSDLRVELSPLQMSETDEFIRSLLRRAGCEHEAFSNEATMRIHTHSRGVPRLVSRLCELSLIAAMAEETHLIDADLVDSVADGLVSTLENTSEPSIQHAYV